MTRLGWAGPLAILCGIVLPAAVSRAAILEVKAVVSGKVLRVTGGFPVEEVVQEIHVPEDTAVLPVEALASISLANDPAGFRGQGLARVRFDDPLLTVAGVPEELNLEVVSYSTSPDTLFVSTGRIVETRRVVFTPEETGRPPGGVVSLNSQFFIRGAAVLWSAKTDADLTDLEALFTVMVRKTVPGQSPQTVLEAAGIVSGELGGEITVDANGGLTPESLLPSNLTGQVVDVGNVRAVVIPNLSLPYFYEAVVGEEFVLEATFEIELGGLTNRRGGSVVLGGPFAELGPVVDDVAQKEIGFRIQTAANDRMHEQSRLPSLPPVIYSLAPACAPMGVELVGLALLAGMFCLVGRRGA